MYIKILISNRISLAQSLFTHQQTAKSYRYAPWATPPPGGGGRDGQGEKAEVTTLSIPLNIRRRAPGDLSALAPSFEVSVSDGCVRVPTTIHKHLISALTIITAN